MCPGWVCYDDYIIGPATAGVGLLNKHDAVFSTETKDIRQRVGFEFARL